MVIEDMKLNIEKLSTRLHYFFLFLFLAYIGEMYLLSSSPELHPLAIQMLWMSMMIVLILRVIVSCIDEDKKKDKQ